MIGVRAADIIRDRACGELPPDSVRSGSLRRSAPIASAEIGKAARTVVLLVVEGISRCQTSRRRRWPSDRICVVCAGGSPATSVLYEVDPPFEVQLEAVDSMTVTTVMDNVSDILMPDQGPAKRLSPLDLGQDRTPTSLMEAGEVFDVPLAEHGYSALVEIAKGEHRHRVLFDAGISPDGVVNNMALLGIDPSSLEAIVCSHGHFDHTTGIDGLIRRLGRINLPVLIHPHFWRRRRDTLPGLEPQEMPTTSRRALEGAGFEVIEEPLPSFLFDRSILITGEVARTTGYEPGYPIQQAWLDGEWVPDPLVLDDQALVVNVKDKGLVVMTGCGHAGVVNICRYARRLTREEHRLYAVLGGFHLNGPLFEPLVPQVCADLGAMAPSVVAPGHCTGWRAVHAMAAQFGEALIPNCVGTRFEL